MHKFMFLACVVLPATYLFVVLCIEAACALGWMR
jgi:hypothetical protein